MLKELHILSPTSYLQDIFAQKTPQKQYQKSHKKKPHIQQNQWWWGISSNAPLVFCNKVLEDQTCIWVMFAYIIEPNLFVQSFFESLYVFNFYELY